MKSSRPCNMRPPSVHPQYPWKFSTKLGHKKVGTGPLLPVPDPRIERLHSLFPLAGKMVYEPGCMEGAVTASLMNLGAQVIACDPHLSNVALTELRLSHYKKENNDVTVHALSMTEFTETFKDGQGAFDVCVHLGLLYHQADPLESLWQASLESPRLYLQTHYASKDAQAHSPGEFGWYKTKNGYWFQGRSFPDGGGQSPVCGLAEQSYWPTIPYLQRMLLFVGYTNLHVAHHDTANCSIEIFAEKK